MREELTSLAYVDCDCDVEEFQTWVWEAVAPFSNGNPEYNSVQGIIIHAWYNKEHMPEVYKYTIYFIPRDHDVPDDQFLMQIKMIKAILKRLRERQCRVYFLTHSDEYFPEEGNNEPDKS